MRKIDLTQVISIFANVGVIAGIVFLSLEVRQNNTFAAQETRATRYLTVVEAYTSLAANTELLEAMMKDGNGEGLTALESGRLRTWWMRIFFSIQWAFREMPDEEIAGFVEIQRTNDARFSAYRTQWAIAKEERYLQPDFIEFTEATAFVY